MPHKNEWIDPELFLRHKGLAIWHVYKENDWDQGRRDYWYSTSFECGEDGQNCDSPTCPHVFDVRELPTWKNTQPPFLQGADDTKKNRQAWDRYQKDEPRFIRKAIKQALDRGVLTEDGIVWKEST